MGAALCHRHDQKQLQPGRPAIPLHGLDVTEGGRATAGHEGDGRCRQDDRRHVQRHLAIRFKGFQSGHRDHPDPFRGKVIVEGSKASASIEADRPTFDKLAAELGAYASALSVAADRNPAVLAPDMRMEGGDVMMGGPLAKRKAAPDPMKMPAEHALHMMLQTCTSCHAKFRVKGA
ncbi:hypothetical protein EMEDMD4_1280017 [Sinorhizobium medicae]|uniref:Cytochrome c n=1 Tax=Sinorhizobium medicae TaxID=110321 RepID=A0A508WQR7_9HYPH|nr:hypothetical protein EMEDMD4_1280017 [Sinorhizobium medicae]